MTALGPCSSLSPTTFISINELTTVAAVYTLAPYIGNYQSIGAGPSDFSALTAAMTTAAQYVSTSTGFAPGNPAPTGDTNPTALINTLGDILSTCVNSTGGNAPDPTPCGQLFTLTTYPGATPPNNTIAALLTLALDPTLNTPALFNLIAPSAPFQPILTTIPPDLNVRFAVPASQQALQISPTSLTFPSTTVSYPSTALPVTIMNSSAATVTFTQIGLLGVNSSDFSQTNNCGSSLLAGATCTVQVTLTPNAPGNRQAYLSVASSAPTSPQYVALSGTAVNGIPHASFSVPVLNFVIGGTNKDVTLTNTGTAPLAITGLTTTSAYFIPSSNCPAALAPSAACTVTILNLAPAQDDLVAPLTTNAAVLNLASSDPTASTGVQLIATNASFIGPGTIVFPGTVVGSSSSTQITGLFAPIYSGGVGCNTLTPSNSAFMISAPTENDRHQTSSIIFTGCTYTLTFSSYAAGIQTGKLPIIPAYGPADGSYIVLTGVGIATAPAAVQVVPSAVTLANGSTAQFTVQNRTTAAVNIQSIALTSGFTSSTTCATSLTAQGQCTVTVAYTATVPGTIQGALTVTDDAGTQTAQLTGATPVTLDFGGAQLNTASLIAYADNVMGQNYSDSGGLTFTPSGDFTGTSCSYIRYSSCSAAAGFKPTATGLRTGLLTVQGGNGTYRVLTETLQYYTQGLGIPTGPSLTFAQLPVAKTFFGTANYVQLTLYNTGSTTLTLTSPTMSGAAAAEFAPTAACTTTLAPATSCSLHFVITPTQYGLRTATFSITDSTSGQVFSKSLTVLSTYVAPSVSAPTPATLYTHINVPAYVAETVTRPINDLLTITVSGTAFSVDRTSCAAGSACSFNIIFTPAYAYAYGFSGTVTLLDTYTNYSTVINVSGVGGQGTASIYPGSIAFPSTPVGSSVTQTVTLQNTGDGPFTPGIYNMGPDSTDFTLANTCTYALTPNSSCSFNVTYSPKVTGAKSTSIAFTADTGSADNLPLSIPVTAPAP